MHKTNNMTFYKYIDRPYTEMEGQMNINGLISTVICRVYIDDNGWHHMAMPIECESVEYRKLSDLVTVALLKNPIIQQKKYTTNKEVFDSIRRTGYRKRCQKVEVVRSTPDTKDPVSFKLTLAPIEELEQFIK